jgi:hypothetical protein
MTSKPPGSYCIAAWFNESLPAMTLPRSYCGIKPSWMSMLARPRSPSNSNVRWPRRASAWLRVIEKKVFPTPPLPDATATNRPRLALTAGRVGSLVGVAPALAAAAFNAADGG